MQEESKTTPLAERLRMKAAVMEQGEKIEWGSDTALMREAAADIDRLNHILTLRDEFIVEKGLWGDFVESLK